MCKKAQSLRSWLLFPSTGGGADGVVAGDAAKAKTKTQRQSPHPCGTAPHGGNASKCRLTRVPQTLNTFLEAVYDLNGAGVAKAKFRKKATLGLNPHAVFCEFQRRITRVSQIVNRFLVRPRTTKPPLTPLAGGKVFHNRKVHLHHRHNHHLGDTL